MKPVATGVIATPTGAKGISPARPRLDAGPGVKPAATTGLVAVRPGPAGACIMFMGELRPVPKTSPWASPSPLLVTVRESNTLNTSVGPPSLVRVLTNPVFCNGATLGPEYVVALPW